MCQCNNQLILEQEREILTLRQQLEAALARIEVMGEHEMTKDPCTLNQSCDDVENRYRVVRHSYWWRVSVGDGQQVVGKCHTETEAQRLAAALLTAFRDGEFFAKLKQDAMKKASAIYQKEFALD